MVLTTNPSFLRLLSFWVPQKSKRALIFLSPFVGVEKSLGSLTLFPPLPVSAVMESLADYAAEAGYLSLFFLTLGVSRLGKTTTVLHIIKLLARG